MAQIGVDIADIMQNPNISLYTNKFAPGKTFVKRASFTGGEQPDHLEEYAIDSIPSQIEGTVTYKGQTMPATAAYVKMVNGEGMSKSAALDKLGY